MDHQEKGLVTALRSALLCTGLFGLAACGGGGGGGNVRSNEPAIAPTTPVTPPPSTQQPPVVSTPNPAYSAHINLTYANVAHQAGITGAGVRIGVVDSGVTRTHPALSPRVVANLNYVPSPPNNLAVDDVAEHGTAVSQIAAGSAFGAWPGGIAPGAEIVSARIIYDKDPEDDGSGQGNEVDGALGLAGIHQDLIARGVRVMNNSWGGLYWTNPAATAPIANEYRPFIFSNNGLVVFATGNEGKANPSSMAALPSQPGTGGTLPAADLERGWLAVTAVNPNNVQQLDAGSDGVVYANACGQAMRYCLAAVGTVAVTGTNDTPTRPTYWRWAGTSLAAPQVSGAAALVWQAFPYFSNDLVRQTLLGGAADLGAPGPDPVFGYGLLNIPWAMRGPTKFDWGDATVNLPSGTSTWSNPISGSGGLIKQGAGKLVLSERNTYTGRTQVLGGELEVQREIVSPITIGPGGTLSGYARFGPTLNQGGTLRVDNLVRIVGDYTQTATGRTSMLLGSWFYVEGTATLAGDLHVLGARQGYTANSHTNFLSAGALVGRYDTLTAATGVFLDATVMYSATEAWLDVRRLDVTAAAQGMGLTAESVGSAQRVEGAFDAIDEGQVDGAGTSGFAAGAGAIQGVATAAAAEQTLSSLSGELHSADTEFALMAIEGNRRALESRVDALHDAPAGGTWYDELSSQRSMSRFDLDAGGWIMGQDRRYGDRLTIGAALAQTEAYAYHDARYDRERNRQLEAQFYAAYDLGAAYLMGNVSLGHMQRWTQRDVILGSEAFRIQSDYADRYATVGLQAGLPLNVGRGRITPYAGVQSLRLERDGFSEDGAFGFGLSTADSSMTASQALFGARYATDWRMGSSLWSLQARLEWQRLLSQSGGDIDARFTALDVWSPILGQAIDRDVGVFGLGLGSWLRDGSRISFDVDSRHDQGGTWSRAMVNWSKSW